MPAPLLAAWLAALGLVVGSYLNVVVHRVPRRLSTVRPRSRCPACGAAIAAADNLPLLSFLLLRGRCRHCGVRIPWRYPLVEATTGMLFVLCFWRFGRSLDAVVGMVLCSLLLALALIDYEHYLLPDRLTYPGIALGLLLSPLVSFTNPVSSVLGALVGATVLLLLIGGWYLLRREWGMGLGDVKMLALLGAFLGLHGMAVALFVAALAGALTGVALLVWGHGDLKTRLPFGVFLSLGGGASLFAARPLLDHYFRLL